MVLYAVDFRGHPFRTQVKDLDNKVTKRLATNCITGDTILVHFVWLNRCIDVLYDIESVQNISFPDNIIFARSLLDYGFNLNKKLLKSSNICTPSFEGLLLGFYPLMKKFYQEEILTFYK